LDNLYYTGRLVSILGLHLVNKICEIEFASHLDHPSISDIVNKSPNKIEMIDNIFSKVNSIYKYIILYFRKVKDNWIFLVATVVGATTKSVPRPSLIAQKLIAFSPAAIFETK